MKWTTKKQGSSQMVRSLLVDRESQRKGKQYQTQFGSKKSKLKEFGRGIIQCFSTRVSRNICVSHAASQMSPSIVRKTLFL